MRGTFLNHTMKVYASLFLVWLLECNCDITMVHCCITIKQLLWRHQISLRKRHWLWLPKSVLIIIRNKWVWQKKGLHKKYALVFSILYFVYYEQCPILTCEYSVQLLSMCSYLSTHPQTIHYSLPTAANWIFWLQFRDFGL